MVNVLRLFPLLGVSVMQAAIITVPTDLKPGDTYRLAFVTPTFRDATSNNIDEYNRFVADAANAIPELNALDADWKAIASTATVNAADNIGESRAPIYRLDNRRIANSTGELWDGTDLFDRFLFYEPPEWPFKARMSWAWTGTRWNGKRDPTEYLGATPYAVVGDTVQLQIPFWIQSAFFQTDSLLAMYAISSVLTVPRAAPIPEPASVGLVPLGLIVLLIVTRIFKRSLNEH